VLGNHDRSRLINRVGGAAQARLAAMLLLTLRGTPTLYYGDELGMHDGAIPPECVQDPWERNVPGLGLGRDPCRTPMQWTDGVNLSVLLSTDQRGPLADTASEKLPLRAMEGIIARIV
jgi:alpha-glucosidase